MTNFYNNTTSIVNRKSKIVNILNIMKNASFANSSGNRKSKIVNLKSSTFSSTKLIVILLLFFSSLAWGQSTVEWGNISDNSGTTEYTISPYGRHYGWEYRVYCYRPNTLPFSGEITSMAFLAATDYSTVGNNTNSSITINGSSDSNPLQIWMKEVPGSTTLSSSTSFASYVSGATKVYSGTNPATTSGSYTTFTLSTPFLHSQENSLLILVRAVANSTSGCNAHECYYKDLSGDLALSWFDKQDGSDPGINNTTYNAYTHATVNNSLPVLRLAYTSSLCTTLTSPADGADISTASPTLQWDAVAGATSYHVYLSNTTTKPAQYSYSTNSTSVTASNIPYGVTYCWVVPCDGNGELISCGDYTQFRRTCPASVTAPTITANADLNNLTCGQTVTLTANGEYSDYRWYSDAACTTQVGSGQTYSFQAGNSPITIYCKSACMVSAPEEGSQDFGYTGYEQTYIVPSGVQSLKLEVWGAQGGYRSSSTYGGKGGYSVGTLSDVTQGQTLYVYVGGSGNTGGTSGGYNGGGGRDSYYGGGGATHIAKRSGLLLSLSSYQSDVLVVAGGGGADGAANKYGMYGGGEIGGTTTESYGSGGGGGSQTAGGAGSSSNTGTNGSFGQGGHGYNANSGYAGAGGGGWYGGAGSYPDTSSDDDRGGGGGSGHVNAILTDAQTIPGNASFPAPNGGTETGHEGNGYALITYTTTGEFSYSSATSATAAAAVTPATPTVSVASACPGEDVVLTVTNAVNGLTYGWWDNSSCTGDPLHEGTTYTISNMQNNATYYVRAYNGSLNPVHNFDYTGAEQTLTIPSNVSSVTLEVWGAQGGTYSSYTGGLGGYSVGTLSNLSGETSLKIYVGGAGTTSTTAGYNGGGAGVSSGRGGGGATDIRIGGSTLYDRIIVAGGGGGAGVSYGSTYPAGCGGGEYGGDGYYNYTNGSNVTGINRSGGGATQTGGGISWSSISSTQGTFGQGGNAYNYSCGGGGGGWYGGGGAYDSDSDSDGRYGGGGSGYVWTSATASSAPSGYNVPSSYYLTDAQTIAGNTSFPAPEGGNETGHTGNGYARITFNVAAPTCMSEIGTVAVDLGTPPTFTLNADNSVSCNQTPVTFTITNPSNGIVRYEWSDGVNTTETTSTTYTVTPGSTTTYTVSAFNSYCSASQSYTISVDAPGVTLTGSDNGDCVNAGTDVTLSFGDCPSSLNMENGTVTIAPGCSFNYYDHNGASSNYVNYEDYTQTFTSADGVPITIEFSNVGAESCCDYIYLYDGEDNTGASLFSDILYNMSTGVAYTANSGSLTIRFTSDVSNVGSGWEATISTATLNYAWSSGSTDPTITVTPTESTTYTVTVTGDGYSCPAIIDYTVRVNPEVEVTPMNPMVCAGRTITLTATGADNYHWSNNALTADITVGAGAYTVTGTNSDGCYAEASTTVTSLSTPSAGTIADMEVCQSDAVITLASTTPAVGGGNVEYSWTIGSVTTAWSENATYTLTASDRATLGTGTFSVARNFRDGCENSGSTTATLTINPPMDAPTVNGLTSIYCGQTTTLTASTSVSGNIHYRWYSDPAGQDLVYEGNEFTTPALDATTTYYVRSVDIPVGDAPIDFDYTGDVQTWEVPGNVTKVQLEVWGAEGGQTNYDGHTWLGGRGGYATGELSVSAGDVLSIYVGGKGGDGTTGTTGSAQGGWNGGGNSGTSTNSGYFYGGGGGGATDIRLNGTTLGDRIIVAGAGGGGAYGTNTSSEVAGGNGGGLTGTQGTYYSSYTGRRGGAGTQDAGGAAGTGGSAGSGNAGTFGIGGDSNSGAASGGGGGGGWYGGGGGADGSQCSGTGGGGSAYIGGVSNGSTTAGNASFLAPDGIAETGHSGNGYARITITEMLPSTSNCPSELVPVTITVNTPPTPIVEVRSACIGTPSELEVVNPIDGFTYQWSTASDFSSIEATGLTFTPTVDAQTNYYVRSVVGNGEEVIDFDYTGSERVWTVPAGVTKVKLEVWGAQGGEGSNYSATGNPYTGGKGGYSVGTLNNVISGALLYIYVGQEGFSGTATAAAWNGGGVQGNTSYPAGTGGGATDIRVGGNSLYNRVIVAGGGGGGGNCSIGGQGGGLSGIQPLSSTQFDSRVAGIGGGQTTGYQFGVGQGSNGENLNGGGGGGWYGGGQGANSTGGGGGSGYVYTSATASSYPSGCLLNSSYYLTEAQTIAGNTSFTAPDGTAETGHSGNGFARITLLDLATDYCPSPTATVTINPVDPPTFSFTTSGSSYCYDDDAVVLTVVPSSNITGYQWSDGATTTEPTHEVTPGHTTRYAVTVTNGTCAIASQEIIIAVDAPEVTLIGSDNGECVVSGTEVTLNANNDESSIKASEYLFSSRTETFQSFSGGTSCTTGDDYTTSNVPIGFSFNYCGNDYTSITNVNTNGVLQFGYSSASNVNNLNSSSYYNVIAPFWDDLVASTYQYRTTGDAPDRVFELQFYGYRYNNSSYYFYYQVKLYEGSNMIEFCYGSSGYSSLGSNASASIGINSYIDGELSFLSVTPTGAGTATYSTSTANNSVAGSASLHNTVYTFTPIPPANYQWAVNGTTLVGEETESLTVSPVESTTYTLTVTNSEHGCPAIWDYTVKVLPTPSLTTDESPICLGAEATLTAGGAGTNGTYNWGEGYVSENTNVVSPTNNTTYRVTVKNVNGCTASSYVDQAVQQVPGDVPTTNVVEGHIWTGRVSGDWNDSHNWLVFGSGEYEVAGNAPSSSDKVIVRSGSTCINNNPIVNANCNASDVIVRSGRTLTIGASQNLTVDGTLDVENGGAITFSSSGTISVSDEATIANGATVTFDNKDTLNVVGDFTLSGNLDFPASDTTPALCLGGNLVIDGGSLDEGGTLVFAGNGPQSINNGGTAPTINNNVRLNMLRSGADVPHTIFPNRTVFSKTTIFEYGIMDGNVIFNGTGRTIVCGDYESYASGTVTKIGGGNNFTFPTGDDNVLGSITAEIGIGNTVYAKFHHWSGENGDGTHGYTTDVIPRWWHINDMCTEDGANRFNHVSNFEYWDVSSPVELSNVTLMANSATAAEHFNSSTAYDASAIKVAAYNNGCWKNFGGSADITGSDNNVITITGARIPKDPHRAVADFLITLGSLSSETVLPIELLSFTATCDGKSSLVEWSTATERNNDYFVLERSDDAINFNEVARVAGAGNSLEQLDYSYTDYGVHGGDNYYRLVQVDYDGTRTVSEVVVANCIEESEGDPDVMAYPNPFNGELTVVLDNFGDRPAQIEVYDMLGKLVYIEKAASPQNSYETILNLSNLPPAAYTVRVSTADFVINKNVVKN